MQTKDALSQTLRRFVAKRSEEDFRLLVETYSGMVLAVARRKLNGSETQAAEVTQQVFTELARRAATLSPQIVLGAWLHRVTCAQAALLVRTETRRRKYEAEAAAAAMISAEFSSFDARAWNELAPALDDELNRLPAADRTALVLRFYERHGIREVGERLGTTEEGARKRITRALERLRTRFVRRGLIVPAIPLLGALLIQRAAEAAIVPSAVIRSLTLHALRTGPLHWWARAWPAAASALAGAAGVMAVAVVPLWQQEQPLVSSSVPAPVLNAARTAPALTVATRPFLPALNAEEGLSLEQIVQRIAGLLRAKPSDLRLARLQSLLAMISQPDASPALTLLAKEIPGVISAEDYLLEELHVLISNAARTDADKTMLWVKVHLSGLHRILAFCYLLGPVDFANPQPELREMLSDRASRIASRDVSHFLHNAVKSLPFQEAAHHLVNLAGQFNSDIPLSTLMLILSEGGKPRSASDWETAWAALSELPAPSRRQAARRIYVQSRAASDPAATRRWLDTLPAEEKRGYASLAVFIPAGQKEDGARAAIPDRAPEIEWLMRAAPDSVPHSIGLWHAEAPGQVEAWLEAHPERITPALVKAGLLRNLSCIAMPEDAAAREEQTAAAAARIRPLMQLLKRHDPVALDRLLKGIITVGQLEILQRSAQP